MGRGAKGSCIGLMGLATALGVLLTAPPGRAEPAPVSTPPSPVFQGVRPFLGFVGATGVVVMKLPTKDEVDKVHNAQVPTALFALKGGLLLGRTELGIEVAPFSQLYWYIPTVEAHAYGGYHLRLSEKVSLPVRAGLGVLMGAKEPRPDLYARADLVGFSIRTSSSLIDVHLSSVRFTPLPARGDRPDGFILSWLVGVGVSWPL